MCFSKQLLIIFFIEFELLYMDDLIDHLLRDERYCDVILPRLQVILADMHMLLRNFNFITIIETPSIRRS